MRSVNHPFDYISNYLNSNKESPSKVCHYKALNGQNSGTWNKKSPITKKLLVDRTYYYCYCLPSHCTMITWTISGKQSSVICVKRSALFRVDMISISWSFHSNFLSLSIKKTWLEYRERRNERKKEEWENCRLVLEHSFTSARKITKK